MSQKTEATRRVEVKEELRACPDCDYADGFHVSFSPRPLRGKGRRIVLVCPNCSKRFDTGWRT